MRRLTFPLCLLFVLTVAASHAQTTKWPTQDGNYVIKNFHFGSGESIPELKLHYLTLGKPHRDAAGHTDNTILLLHGTGGRRSFPDEPGLFRCAFRSWPAF
jgi:homoserine O-acetyltransferase